ncbi:MAG: phosphatidylglycerol lysyltransferase [Spirochaetales bacterium]|jgi:phosphoglucomutase|nr:phosphatidylglycerol lysyltransferase [Spirochaetales bacterium]
MLHTGTGFFLGDPYARPFPTGYRGDPAARGAAMENFILSASGWRTLFAAGGGGENRAEDISLAGRELAAAMAQTFADFIFQRGFAAHGGPCLAVGIDSRFTGPRIAEMMIRVFLLRGIRPRYLFITPAPEIMAWAGANRELDGFVYVSASHNPVGYNGVKFGLGGGVLGGEDSRRLIQAFRNLTADKARMSELIAALTAASPEMAEKLEPVFQETSRWKKEAEASYETFIRRVITGEDDSSRQRAALEILRSEILSRGCGLAIDFNGSARTLSIDRPFLEGFGVALKTMGAKPREITHTIEPEGEALQPCRKQLEEAHAADPRFIFGYVPDNDGDRGNIVFWDEPAARARILEAQEVFALACYAELAFLAWRNGGGLPAKTAVAVNDPTSVRIDRIAQSFGAKVFRAEVGEANVVSLAKKLREEGWTVRILGEGSNGGVIIRPSEVRDPLSTVFALLKLLYLPLFDSRPARTSLSAILSGLPRFLTLSASADEARLTIKTQDHGVLKERYEEIFLREWEARKKDLAGFGIASWEEINHEGVTARSGMGKAFRSGAGRGGLTLLLKDPSGTPRAFLWMRGSGTEPLFRVCVDLEGGDAKVFEYLLKWHTGMVMEADNAD